MYVLRGFKAFIPSLEEFCEEHMASGPSGNALEMQQQSPHIHASGSVSRHIHQQQQEKQQQVLSLIRIAPNLFHQVY